MSKKEVVAAGGVILNDAKQVLLIHRPRYGDWSLPKGKIDAGESIEDAAVREVREEAGLQCEIVRWLADSRYTYKTRAGEMKPKVVHYFLMRVTGGELNADGTETDEAMWCDIKDAEKRLNYQGDRDILRLL